MGTLQFTDREIATIAGLPVEELTAKYAENIDRGRLLAEAEVRKAVLKSAKDGNAPAQKQFMSMNKRAKWTKR